MLSCDAAAPIVAAKYSTDKCYVCAEFDALGWIQHVCSHCQAGQSDRLRFVI